VASYTLFSQPVSPSGSLSGTTSYRAWGNVFTVSQAITLTGIWVYSGPGSNALPAEIGIFVAGTGIVSGTDNAAPSWSGAAASGWVKCTYGGTVTLSQGVNYIVTAAGPNQWLWSDATYWSSGAGSGGITNGPLSAPSDATSPAGSQGLFNSSGPPMGLPGGFGAGRNPWVDVEVSPPAPPAAPQVAFMSSM
jgi:hypothetical protein